MNKLEQLENILKHVLKASQENAKVNEYVRGYCDCIEYVLKEIKEK